MQQLVVSLAPSLTPEKARKLFVATDGLAGHTGVADKHLQLLRQATAHAFNLSTTLESSLLRRHNVELKAKLEVMAALPQPTAQTYANDVVLLRRALAEVPDPAAIEFARCWLRLGQFKLNDTREALCFLVPVPRSLLRAARQVAWESAQLAGWARPTDELRADYLVLKVLQCVTVMHAATHGPDGPSLWENRCCDREQRYAPICCFEATTLAESTAVMQSTHTSEVLEQLVKLFQKAAYPPL